MSTGARRGSKLVGTGAVGSPSKASPSRYRGRGRNDNSGTEAAWHSSCYFYIDKSNFMNIITWWMISPPRRGKWFLSTGRAEMAVISEEDLDGLIAEIGVGLKPGTVRAQTRTEIGTLIAVAKRGDPRRVTRVGAREGFEPVFKHAVALLKAIESDPHQRVKFALCHFLDGMEPRVPS